MGSNMRTDSRLQQNNLDQGVATKDEVAALGGHVSGRAGKITVGRTMPRVKGIRSIAQEIDAHCPSDDRTADCEIARRALGSLNWDVLFPAGAVQVKVRNGQVTLTGQVDWHFQSTAAESRIRELSGVTGVTNEITIRPRVESADVKREIDDALKCSTEIDTKGIHVSSLGGGRIALEGQVHNWQEREAVRRAAWSAVGVSAVDDYLQIP
jgi:osmotically-inducible protein OsmY